MNTSIVQFAVYRMFPDSDGYWNPVGEGPYRGGLQISINSTAEGYRQLADYFQRLAEVDTSADPYYHEHHAPIVSIDGETRIEVICRKDDMRMKPAGEDL
jgi:hypothetical protein